MLIMEGVKRFSLQIIPVQSIGQLLTILMAMFPCISILHFKKILFVISKYLLEYIANSLRHNHRCLWDYKYLQ